MGGWEDTQCSNNHWFNAIVLACGGLAISWVLRVNLTFRSTYSYLKGLSGGFCSFTKCWAGCLCQKYSPNSFAIYMYIYIYIVYIYIYIYIYIFFFFQFFSFVPHISVLDALAVSFCHVSSDVSHFFDSWFALLFVTPAC